MDPYVGEIRMVGFNFAPTGWAFCDGSSLKIDEYDELYYLIGTTYGGDGETFQIPDLRSRAPLHFGQGDGLQARQLAERGGTTSIDWPKVEVNLPDVGTDLHIATGVADEGNLQPYAVVNFIICLKGVFPCAS